MTPGSGGTGSSSNSNNNIAGPSRIVHHAHAHSHALAADDGTGASTDSEAGGSHRGWSDAGWHRSPTSSNTRLSISSSSGEDYAQSYYASTSNTTAYEPPSSPTTSTNTMQQRRNTLSRPAINTFGPKFSPEALTPKEGGRFIYPPGPGPGSGAGLVGLGPSPVLSNGYGYSSTNGGIPGSAAYGAHPRSRGKSAITPESETDEYRSVNGAQPALHMSKARSKRNRAGSNSYLPSHSRVSSQLSSSWPLRLRGGGRISMSKRSTSNYIRQWGIPFLFALLAFLGLVAYWRRYYELQLEFSLFSKQWVRREIEHIQPLRGCFQSPFLSPQYNMSKHLAPRRFPLSPGIALRRGMSCYDFSATIQPQSDMPLEHLIYHTYWRSDLLAFGERQTATLLAFLATQPLTHSKLILWTNDADIISNNEYVRPFLESWGDNIQVRRADMTTLTQGTELAKVIGNMAGSGLYDQRGWVDGDAIRLLVLWQYGGIWMDMDELLTRDLHPLTESEWVTQWDCYDKPYFSLNGALMHFERHSPYICEAFHIMATEPLPAPNSFTWGSHLYAKVHRALLAEHVKPFQVLPWCFADPRNCRTDNRLPDPFQPDPKTFAGTLWSLGGREILESKVRQIWSIHLHNQWNKKFPKDGWVERLLATYRQQVDHIKRYEVESGYVEGEDWEESVRSGHNGEGIVYGDEHEVE